MDSVWDQNIQIFKLIPRTLVRRMEKVVGGFPITYFIPPTGVEVGSLDFRLGKDSECLSATAQRLASIIKETVKRPADLVDRYGGEELAVVLHHTDQK